jgi:membrane protein implicated in regulation of membrane protease activity
MNAIDVLISPPVAFLIFLGLGFLLYALGRRLAPKLKKVGGKLATYACGEDLPGVKLQFGYRLFFFIALFFTMMHVAALVIATIPGGKIVFFGIIYLVMISLSIAALVTRS